MEAARMVKVHVTNDAPHQLTGVRLHHKKRNSKSAETIFPVGDIDVGTTKDVEIWIDDKNEDWWMVTWFCEPSSSGLSEDVSGCGTESWMSDPRNALARTWENPNTWVYAAGDVAAVALAGTTAGASVAIAAIAAGVLSDVKEGNRDLTGFQALQVKNDISVRIHQTIKKGQIVQVKCEGIPKEERADYGCRTVHGGNLLPLLQTVKKPGRHQHGEQLYVLENPKTTLPASLLMPAFQKGDWVKSKFQNPTQQKAGLDNIFEVHGVCKHDSSKYWVGRLNKKTGYMCRSITDFYHTACPQHGLGVELKASGKKAKEAHLAAKKNSCHMRPDQRKSRMLRVKVRNGSGKTVDKWALVHRNPNIDMAIQVEDSQHVPLADDASHDLLVAVGRTGGGDYWQLAWSFEGECAVWNIQGMTTMQWLAENKKKLVGRTLLWTVASNAVTSLASLAGGVLGSAVASAVMSQANTHEYYANAKLDVHGPTPLTSELFGQSTLSLLQGGWGTDALYRQVDVDNSASSVVITITQSGVEIQVEAAADPSPEPHTFRAISERCRHVDHCFQESEGPEGSCDAEQDLNEDLSEVITESSEKVEESLSKSAK